MRIGIDLGGTKTEIIVIDDQGHEHYRKRTPTPNKNYQATLNTIEQLVSEAEALLHYPYNTPCSIGICIPGTLSPDSRKVKNANSVCLIGKALDQDLQALLNRPIRIANDADCFTLSEASDGAGSGHNSVFGVILGTGVGGGICIHGQLLGGPNAIAGEWGHNPLPWLDPEKDPQLSCYCGKQGCIETYLSGPGFCQHFSNATSTRISTTEEIMSLYHQGDNKAQQAFEQYCDRLARGLASVINVLDPEIVILGGGLSNIKELYQQVPSRWGNYVFSDQVNTKLVQAKHGDSSGVRGAAWLWPSQK